jgi:deazaflavin-dependent oxidoreductase (nitroreductase family)
MGTMPDREIATGAPPDAATTEPYCYLTTTGRVTGQPHEVELWFAADPEADGPTLYLLAGGRERTDWVRNLAANPAVCVRLAGETYAVTGRVVEGLPAEGRARELLAAKYYGWSGGPLPNDWARRALPVALTLDASESAGARRTEADQRRRSEPV